MGNLRGTKTLENLMKSFAGESQARMRYTYFASVAGKEGYKQIQNIFMETAENEKEHAKVFMKLALQYLDGRILHQLISMLHIPSHMVIPKLI